MWNRRRVAVREQEVVVRDHPGVREAPVVPQERVIREDPPRY
jgi:hypothetical protein